MQKNRLEIGNYIESAALNYLQQQGIKLVGRNFRCKYGEIDLIMRDVSQLIFIEVRYRKSKQYGSPEFTVDRYKQKRIINTAKYYLITLEDGKVSCRFDVIAVTKASFGLKFNWIKGAFY